MSVNPDIHRVDVGSFKIGSGLPLALIAGPCQIEGRDHALFHAEALLNAAQIAGMNFIYKSSFDKANRTSANSARGVGIEEGLRILEDVKQNTTITFKDEGDLIVTLGALNGSLGGSEYLKTIHGKVEGPIPHLNLELEMNIQQLCLDAIKKGIIKSAHDISEGGLAVNVSESIAHSKEGIGAKLDLARKLKTCELLFGECQSVIVVTIEEENLYELVILAKQLDMHTQTIGRVTNSNDLIINDEIKLSRNKIEDAYFHSLRKIMEQ